MKIEVESTVIFQLRPDVKSTGTKMTIHNNSVKDLVITGFNSEEFAMTMMHSTKFESGQRVMSMVKDIVVPANKKLALTPNTRHFKMFNPVRKFELGEFLETNGSEQSGRV